MKRFALSRNHTILYDYFERDIDDGRSSFVDRISLIDHTHPDPIHKAVFISWSCFTDIWFYQVADPADLRRL